MPLAHAGLCPAPSWSPHKPPFFQSAPLLAVIDRHGGLHSFGVSTRRVDALDTFTPTIPIAGIVLDAKTVRNVCNLLGASAGQYGESSAV